jgi:hypothetical protein
LYITDAANSSSVVHVDSSYFRILNELAMSLGTYFVLLVTGNELQTLDQLSFQILYPYTAAILLNV